MNLYQKKTNKKEQQPNERICLQVPHKTPPQPSPPRLEQRTNRQALLTPAIRRPSVSEREEEKKDKNNIYYRTEGKLAPGLEREIWRRAAVQPLLTTQRQVFFKKKLTCGHFVF